MFEKATRKNINLRCALVGVAGTGKTYTSLMLGDYLAKKMDTRMAVIDTEASGAERYAHLFEFDICKLDVFYAEKYMEAIKKAAEAKYGVLVVDSFSHAWDAAGGILERVEAYSKRKGNSFSAWAEATPLHRKLLEALLRYPGQVIVTMRAKIEYVVEQNEGKTTIRRAGFAPVQRQGIEYEFDIICDMDTSHSLLVSKCRGNLADRIYNPPDQNFCKDIYEYIKGY